MGQQRQRFLKFLAQNPYCCFCGGAKRTETRDHIPPSSVFSNHKWPEGYEFPACVGCNNGSAEDDSVLALFSRFNPGAERSEADAGDFRRYLKAFNERFPGKAREALLTANEKRRYLERRGIAKPDGMAYGELPIIKFTPFVRERMDRFAQKMTRAFHYKHTQKIVPSNAWLMTRFWTNLHRVMNEIPQELFAIMPSGATLRRDGRFLDDQFSYRFAVSEDGTIGAFLASFRRTFLVTGLVCFDAAVMRDIGDDTVDAAMKSSGVVLDKDDE